MAAITEETSENSSIEVITDNFNNQKNNQGLQIYLRLQTNILKNIMDIKNKKNKDMN